MLQVLVDLSSSVAVPEMQVAQQRVSANRAPEQGPDGPPLVRITSGSEEPKDAFVSVPYREYWFWIDDRDPLSKRILSFMLFAVSLIDVGAKGGAPVLTIPAQ
ncbi:MAG TPA: hypothetical protein VMT17_12030 [Anaeromyxobacteraceae bacterium]|nr:hypothetical protein [Anaeromyxobacteraceae bacterium]